MYIKIISQLINWFRKHIKLKKNEVINIGNWSKVKIILYHGKSIIYDSRI